MFVVRHRTRRGARRQEDCAAIITADDPGPYIQNLVPYLVDEGLMVLLVSGSETLELHRSLLQSLPASRFEFIPHETGGTFSLRKQLQEKEQLLKQIDSEWILHLDIDEVPHSRRRGESLIEAVNRLGSTGANVLNFDEFVFLPVDHDYSGRAGVYQPMKFYYFHEPRPNRLNRIFKKELGFVTLGTGGHTATGDGLHVAPESLVLRHYPFISQQHALEKYAHRTFDQAEVGRGWHSNRIKIDPGSLEFPPRANLNRLSRPRSRTLGRANPRSSHYWEWPSETRLAEAR